MLASKSAIPSPIRCSPSFVQQCSTCLCQVAAVTGPCKRRSCSPHDIPDDPLQITPEQWEDLKSVDIRTVDKSQLVDLNTVVIDESKPVPERILSYLKQVKNPYAVRVGNVAVKIKYAENGPPFEEVFKHLLEHQMMLSQ